MIFVTNFAAKTFYLFTLKLLTSNNIILSYFILQIHLIFNFECSLSH